MKEHIFGKLIIYQLRICNLHTWSVKKNKWIKRRLEYRLWDSIVKNASKLLRDPWDRGQLPFLIIKRLLDKCRNHFIFLKRNPLCRTLTTTFTEVDAQICKPEVQCSCELQMIPKQKMKWNTEIILTRSSSTKSIYKNSFG